LIFIDADKTSYPTYLSLILSLSPPDSGTRLLRKNGIILADNILRSALVADSSPANPATQSPVNAWASKDKDALDEFNKALVNSERLNTFLMPMFDGLGCGRLVD
jgi:predicted O-methyltransferase YrrM